MTLGSEPGAVSLIGSLRFDYGWLVAASPAFELRRALGSDRVFRLSAEEGELDLVPAYEEGGILFGEQLTFGELSRRFDAGAGIVEVPANGGADRQRVADGLTPLFMITASGNLRVATAGTGLEPGTGDRLICLTEGHRSHSP